MPVYECPECQHRLIEGLTLKGTFPKCPECGAQMQHSAPNKGTTKYIPREKRKSLKEASGSATTCTLCKKPVIVDTGQRRSWERLMATLDEGTKVVFICNECGV